MSRLLRSSFLNGMWGKKALYEVVIGLSDHKGM